METGSNSESFGMASLVKKMVISDILSSPGVFYSMTPDKGYFQLEKYGTNSLFHFLLQQKQIMNLGANLLFSDFSFYFESKNPRIPSFNRSSEKTKRGKTFIKSGKGSKNFFSNSAVLRKNLTTLEQANLCHRTQPLLKKRERFKKLQVPIYYKRRKTAQNSKIVFP